MGAEERWVGVEDVAVHIGVAKDSIYRWIEEKGLPAHRVGRLFRFKLSEVDEWVRNNKEREKTPNPVPKRLSSKTQINQPKPKTGARQKSGNE
ncbi:MAG TPA: DNA-binding protein [Syntrophus sp. (in: bacteria)]|nr:DNA-binding protein [Syntrophus sp. (in: bacteria)]